MFVRTLFPQVLMNADQGGSVGGEQGESKTPDNDNTNSHENNRSEDAHKQDHMIPKSRFDEVNNKFKDVQAQLDQLLQEKQNQELETKKKQGEFENLYEEASKEAERFKGESTQYSSRVQELEGIIEGMVQSKLEEIPEELHDIIPNGMSPEQKLQWIATAQSKGLFGAKTNPKENEELGGSTNNNGEKHVDVSKMSATELFMSAFGRKDK